MVKSSDCVYFVGSTEIIVNYVKNGQNHTNKSKRTNVLDGWNMVLNGISGNKKNKKKAGKTQNKSLFRLLLWDKTKEINQFRRSKRKKQARNRNGKEGKKKQSHLIPVGCQIFRQFIDVSPLRSRTSTMQPHTIKRSGRPVCLHFGRKKINNKITKMVRKSKRNENENGQIETAANSAYYLRNLALCDYIRFVVWFKLC